MEAERSMPPRRRRSLLGVPVDELTLGTAVEQMRQAVLARRGLYACTCPVYTLMMARSHPEVRAALAGAGWVTPDGMPVVWALRALGARGVGRVYGPDLMLALSAVSAREGLAQFYLGGAPGVGEQLAAALQLRFPGLRSAGGYSPPFRDLTTGEEEAMVAQINASGAAIVWVGLGSPKQDLWMARFRPLLAPPLLVGVGAAFDFFTGRVRQAPRAWQRLGLEWAFRLLQEPRRLWRRYLLYNPLFLALVARQLVQRGLGRAAADAQRPGGEQGQGREDAP